MDRNRPRCWHPVNLSRSHFSFAELQYPRQRNNTRSNSQGRRPFHAPSEGECAAPGNPCREPDAPLGHARGDRSAAVQQDIENSDPAASRFMSPARWSAGVGDAGGGKIRGRPKIKAIAASAQIFALAGKCARRVLRRVKLRRHCVQRDLSVSRPLYLEGMRARTLARRPTKDKSKVARPSRGESRPSKSVFGANPSG
jgi:hypothetical protein